ncbi:hypothetical protein GQ53DRAFT_706756 [Thozetella sp. PMI_491]|nr:hypothetical protein GQ53DRAFT_706756 [Thozetella sp. PMI_491]
MKLSAVIAISSLASVQASWTFDAYCPDALAHPQAWSGSGNKACTSFSPTCKKGDHIEWDRSVLSSCILRLYSGQPCTAAQELGSSGADWYHELGQAVGAWGVTGC